MILENSKEKNSHAVMFIHIHHMNMGRNLLSLLNMFGLLVEEGPEKGLKQQKSSLFSQLHQQILQKGNSSFTKLSPLGRDKDDKGLVQLNSTIISSVCKHFS